MRSRLAGQSALYECGIRVQESALVRAISLFPPFRSFSAGKLVGHTDNIRAILLSEDAKYVSASSFFSNHISFFSATNRICRRYVTTPTDLPMLNFH
jgi:hypothetical protein